jgi:hypothetical protein
MSRNEAMPQEDRPMTTPSNLDVLPSAAPGLASLLSKSLLSRELQAELEEILKHKWIESEKAGHDIGLECARVDWIVKHRFKWRKARACCRLSRRNPSAENQENSLS